MTIGLLAPYTPVPQRDGTDPDAAERFPAQPRPPDHPERRPSRPVRYAQTARTPVGGGTAPPDNTGEHLRIASISGASSAVSLATWDGPRRTTFRIDPAPWAEDAVQSPTIARSARDVAVAGGRVAGLGRFDGRL